MKRPERPDQRIRLAEILGRGSPQKGPAWFEYIQDLETYTHCLETSSVPVGRTIQEVEAEMIVATQARVGTIRAAQELGISPRKVQYVARARKEGRR